MGGLLNKIKPHREITEQTRKVGELPAFFISGNVAVIGSAVAEFNRKIKSLLKS